MKGDSLAAVAGVEVEAIAGPIAHIEVEGVAISAGQHGLDLGGIKTQVEKIEIKQFGFPQHLTNLDQE